MKKTYKIISYIILLINISIYLLINTYLELVSITLDIYLHEYLFYITFAITFLYFYYFIKEFIDSTIGSAILSIILNIFLYLTLAVILSPLIFLNMCGYSKPEILFINKKDKNFKIISREYGCGATDSSPSTTHFFTAKYYCNLFFHATEIDTSNINKENWIKVKE